MARTVTKVTKNADGSETKTEVTRLINIDRDSLPDSWIKTLKDCDAEQEKLTAKRKAIYDQFPALVTATPAYVDAYFKGEPLKASEQVFVCWQAGRGMCWGIGDKDYEQKKPKGKVSAPKLSK